MSPNMGGTWPASPFDSPVLHGLQSGATAGTTRHPNIGETQYLFEKNKNKNKKDTDPSRLK